MRSLTKGYSKWSRKLDGRKLRVSHDLDSVKCIASFNSSIHSINRVLDGHKEYLNTAFVWYTSPQGDKYWGDICLGAPFIMDDVKFLLELRENFFERST